VKQELILPKARYNRRKW